MISSKPIVPSKNVDNILKEFFIKDKGITAKGLIRNSTLLSCKRDFLFLRGVKLDKDPYYLNKDQASAIKANLPTFAAILVFCSSIDLLGRVMIRKIGAYKSRDLFIKSARRWFKMNRSRSNELWNLRCAMSHQYMISRNHTAIPFGTTGSMTYDKKTKKWIFNLNGMFGDIRKAIEAASIYINSKSLKTKQKYANFIYEYGFFYTRIPL